MSRFLHSTSSHKDFAVCSQKFLLSQTGAARGEAPDMFRFGITAHLVMQLYVDHCIARGRRTDVTIIGDFIDAAVRTTGLSLSRYDELTEVIRGYLAVYEIDVEHSLEREGGMAFDDDLNLVPWSENFEYENMPRPVDIAASGVMIRRKLDEVLLFPDEKRLLIRDFKSDLFAPSQSAIEDPSSRFNQQARAYAWSAWRALFPAEIVDVEFPFIRYTAFGHALTRTLTFTRDHILAIEEQELAKIRFIEQTHDFPPRPGSHCSTCVYRHTACPVPMTVSVNPAAIARRFLFERVLQDERREQIKDAVALGGWSGELGALRSAFEQGESEVPDMEMVWKELQDVGFEEPWRVMSLSKTDAKGLLDKDVYERILKNAYSPEITVRFNLHQKKEKLIELAMERGIATQIRGQKGLKDKTVAQLAWDLAVPGAAIDAATTAQAANDAELAMIEEIH